MQLRYLAAHSGALTFVVVERNHGDKAKPWQRQTVSERNLKPQKHAIRAEYELERRDHQKALPLHHAIAALIGAVASGLFASGVSL